MTFRLPRLWRARKRARLAIKQAKRLLKKFGSKIDAVHAAEVREALDALVAAEVARDPDAIYEALQKLDGRVEQRLGHLRKSPTREYIEGIAFAVAIALLLRAFVIEAFTIPSGSMIPTLAVGDFLFVNKLSYGLRIPYLDKMLLRWGQPERGDVVVFVFPCDTRLDYIKRVVGIPGDEIFTDREGFVYLNGVRVDEVPDGPFERLAELAGEEGASNHCEFSSPHHYSVALGHQAFGTLHCGKVAPEELTGPQADDPPFIFSAEAGVNACPPRRQIVRPVHWKVPEGYVFVMGDNRENSQDSRYWGFVPMGAIKGKAMFIWMSWDGAKSFSRPWEKIRWSRLFSGVHQSTD